MSSFFQVPNQDAIHILEYMSIHARETIWSWLKVRMFLCIGNGDGANLESWDFSSC